MLTHVARSLLRVLMVPIFLGLRIFVTTALAAPPQTDDIDRRFDGFKQERRQILDALVVPIEHCVRRQDTNYIAFHGCIDWHSAVHGTWALVKYTRLTGDTRYVP